MGRNFFFIVLTVLVFCTYVFLCQRVWQVREVTRSASEASYVIPSKFSRILALDYKGLLSDYQLLKVMTFYGERTLAERALNEADWRYMVGALDAITDLDPHFQDPYILIEGLLAWDAGMIEEANRLLQKGMKYRERDWQIPFFIGFNYFYFRGDVVKGAEYLMTASQLPGGPAFLAPLAARLGYYGGKAKTAIMFLQGVLAQTRDEVLRRRLQKRLLALERADQIEEALGRFKDQYDHLPTDLRELVVKGFLPALPDDPYGGEWVIMKTGRLFSTSKFVDAAKAPADPPPN